MRLSLLLRAGSDVYPEIFQKIASASEPILRFEICPGFGFGRIRLRFVIVDPPGQRRQRHQDRFRPPARLQSEYRSAVIDQVEFDVPPAPDQLKFALTFAVTVMSPEF